MKLVSERLRRIASRFVPEGGAASSSRTSRILPRMPHRGAVPRRPVERARRLLKGIPREPFLPLLLLGGLLAVYGFWQFVGSSEYFQVRTWNIQGEEHLTEADVTRIVGGTRRNVPLHLVRFDAAAARESLESNPRVFSAAVRKQWPDGLDIKIVERKPQALLMTREGGLLIDIEGVVMSRAAAAEILDGDVPLLTAPDGTARKPGDQIDKAFLDSALLYARVMRESRSELGSRLSEINWDPQTGITLYMRGGARLVCGHLPPEETMPRAEALARRTDGLRDVATADLRIAEQLPWRPRRPTSDVALKTGPVRSR